MESTRKRKASNATPTSAEGSASKKLRLLNNSAAPKSQVQEVGRRILEQLRNASDKTGRLIAIEFVELPDEDELPEYYDIIKLPIALDTIEAKLKHNEYPTISAIESDLKRMVQNAKEFNDSKSVIFEDAERIRKLVFNFMKTNNPEYKENPNYSATPTEIPGGPVQNGRQSVKHESKAPEPAPAPIKLKTKQSSVARSSEADRKSSVAPSAATGEEDGEDDLDVDDDAGEDIDFTGKSFQEAQQMIVSYLLHYTDDEGLEIYTPFGNLPTRKLEDYYKVIRHPVSLKSVAKRTKGIHGRAPPSNITDFKTWDAFEEEVSFIWRNAKVYNEDGSDMYNLAIEFEDHFKTILAEAKEKIEAPGQRIKIGGPKPKVTLSLGGQHRGSPAPGVTVDNEALARQRQTVQAGVNGQQQARPPAAVNGNVAELARPSSSARSGSPLGAVIKAEKAPSGSPAPNGMPPTLTNGMMPPPAARPMSGSPYPGHAPVQTYFTAPVVLPPTQLRTYPKESALLPNVTITTHPNLQVSNPLRLSIDPHDTLSHQSTTTTLPSSHYFLQINATISKELTLHRPYKLFATINGSRLTQRDNKLESESNRRTMVYEPSLMQGVNRIEVEVAAAKVDDEKTLDVEKVTVYANLMR